MANTIQGGEYKGHNDEHVLTASFSASGAHDMPSVNVASNFLPWDGRGAENVAVWVTNGQDVDLTAKLHRTHAGDASMSDAVVDASGTVSAGGSIKVLAADPDVPMGYFKLSVSFATNPSGSAQTTAVWESSGSG